MSQLFVTDKSPTGYASGVYIDSLIWAQFSVPVLSSTVTYYNFTVNEKNTYEPVEGTVTLQPHSGVLDLIAVFQPNSNLQRNTEYAVLVSTGIKAKVTNDYLEDDYVWYFTTGNDLSPVTPSPSGDIPASGDFEETETTTTGVDTESNTYLEVIETVPTEYAYNVETNIPFIGIKFNGVIPSGINLKEYISLSSRRILG